MKTKQKQKRHPVWDDLDRIREEHGAKIYESLVREFGDPFKLKEPRNPATNKEMKTKEKPEQKTKRHPVWDDLDRAKEEIGAEIYESLVREFGDSFKLKEPKTQETA